MIVGWPGGGPALSVAVSAFTMCIFCSVVCATEDPEDIYSSYTFGSPAYDDEPLNLVLLQVLFRHGDRSPMASYPNDTNDALWPQGFAQLTKVGMEQAFEYGKELRERYAAFLPAEYLRSQVYVRSTNVDRTLMTAQSLLTGLFPKDMKDWPPGIWQPIPIHTQANDADQLFAHAPCPRTENLKRQWTNTQPAAAKNIPQYKNLVKSLAKYTNISTLDDLHRLSDTIFCETVHNGTRPAWLTDDIHRQLMEFRNDSVQFLITAPGTPRLFGGPMLSEMTKNMEDKANNTSDFKLFLFSAHDTNVISLGRAMGILDDIQPPYLTSIIVELYEKNQQYFVSILFDNHTANSPFVKSIPGCEEMCPLQQFRRLLEDNMLSAADREAACARPSISRDNLVVILTGVVMVLAVTAAVLVFNVFRSRQRRQRFTSNLRYQQLLQNTADDDTDDDVSVQRL